MPLNEGHNRVASQISFTNSIDILLYRKIPGIQFIDREKYSDQLRSSCLDDKELLRVWVDGDWAIAHGAYLTSVLDEKRNAVDPWQGFPPGWQTCLRHDFGSSAPSATYIVAKSPGVEGPDGNFYPRDSIVIIDELATNKRDGSVSRMRTCLHFAQQSRNRLTASGEPLPLGSIFLT